VSIFAGPILVIKIIPYVESSTDDFFTSVRILLILVSAKFISTTSMIQIGFRLELVARRMKSVLAAAIYEKVLRFSLLRSSDYSPGDLTNLLVVDTHKLYLCMIRIHSMFVFPMLLLQSIVFMYTQVNVSFLAGFMVVGVMGFVGTIFMKRISKQNFKLMKKTDRRVKMVNEIFNNIKVIKMNGWESLFNKRLNNVRLKELKTLTKLMLWQIYNFSVM